MYTISFEVSDLKDRKRSTRQRQIYNDALFTLNNKVYQCKTEAELLERLKYLSGRASDIDRNKEYTCIKKHGDSPYYNTLPGLCMAYVDLEEEIEKVNAKSKNSIKIERFYDIRQRGTGMLSKCFINIIKNN